MLTSVNGNNSKMEASVEWIKANMNPKFNPDDMSLKSGQRFVFCLKAYLFHMCEDPDTRDPTTGTLYKCLGRKVQLTFLHG